MLDITKEDINVLLKLQEAETETVLIDSFLKQSAGEKSKLDEKLAEFENSLNIHKIELEKAEKDCRDTEAEIQVHDQRIKTSRERLKQVKTNREYQALQREIDDGKKRKEELETLLLQYLEQQEKAAKVFKEQQIDFDQFVEKIKADKEDIDRKSETHKKLLEKYKKQKETIGRDLKPELLKLFNEIAESNGGLVVAPVRDEVCMGCFMNIPPQLYIDVLRGKSLIMCPQCNRILYYAEEDTDEE